MKKITYTYLTDRTGETLAYNNCGLFVSDQGRIFKQGRDYSSLPYEFICNETDRCEFFTILEPEFAEGGYLFIDSKYIPISGLNSTITKNDGTKTTGKFIHQMVVFTFGDKNGLEYSSKGRRCVIDHIDMNHGHNQKENLQVVSYGINLWRAYDKTKVRNSESEYAKNAAEGCEKRFKDYYNSLDEFDKKVLDMEIYLDIQGLY